MVTVTHRSVRVVTIAWIVVWWFGFNEPLLWLLERVVRILALLLVQFGSTVVI